MYVTCRIFCHFDGVKQPRCQQNKQNKTEMFCQKYAWYVYNPPFGTVYPDVQADEKSAANRAFALAHVQISYTAGPGNRLYGRGNHSERTVPCVTL